MMQLLLKIVLSVVIVLAATAVAKKMPSLAGLIGVMPLAGALVLVFVYRDNHGDPAAMRRFAQGAIWGILPTVLFYIVALICFQKQLPLPLVLVLSFAVWLAAACVHQWLLG